MRCRDFKHLLQQRLDGEPIDLVAYDDHLAECDYCRSLDAAAERLQDGLRLMTAPVPPFGLPRRITRQVRLQRQRQAAWRRRVPSMAVAATLLVAAYLGLGRPHPDVAPEIQSGDSSLSATLPARVSLQQNVEQAGTALTSLLSRKTDEALAKGRTLVPSNVPAPTLLAGAGTWPGSFEPPVQSLRAASTGVSGGLEPVLDSARRAVHLFLRDVPTKKR